MEPEQACSHIRNIEGYLSKFREGKIRAAAFEYLVTSAVAHIFSVPHIQSGERKTPTTTQVMWYGTEEREGENFIPASEGCDGVCKGNGGWLVIEATTSTGNNQWRQEFCRSLDHLNDFKSSNGLSDNNTYLMLVATEISSQTFRSFASVAKETDNRIALVDLEILIILQELAQVSPTVTHTELFKMMETISECLKASASIGNYLRKINRKLLEWRKELLIDEAKTLIGIESYKTLLNSDGVSSMSDISKQLLNNSRIKKLLELTEIEILPNSKIHEAIVTHRFGIKVGSVGEGDFLYESFTVPEFKKLHEKITELALHCR